MSYTQVNVLTSVRAYNAIQKMNQTFTVSYSLKINVEAVNKLLMNLILTIFTVQCGSFAIYSQ